MAEGPLRFGVLGCGRMGERRIRTILEHPEAVLVCVDDLDAGLARERARAAGCEHRRGLLPRHDLDCAVVSVPNRWHRDLAVSLLEAGVHVFCEKPMARNAPEARQMVDAARRGEATLKVGSNLRYFPSVLKARELMSQGVVGRPLFARARIGHDGWTRDGWYGDPDLAGGGTFLDNGAHVLDLVRWFMGEVRSCTGRAWTALWPLQVEDNAVGIFEMEGGATAVVHASWTEWRGYMEMEIYGADGFLRMDNSCGACKVSWGGRDGRETVLDYSQEPPSSYDVEFDRYVRSVREGREPEPSGFDGLRAVEMACAVYESSRTGRRVDLPVLGPFPTGS